MENNCANNKYARTNSLSPSLKHTHAWTHTHRETCTVTPTHITSQDIYISLFTSEQMLCFFQHTCVFLIKSACLPAFLPASLPVCLSADKVSTMALASEFGSAGQIKEITNCEGPAARGRSKLHTNEEMGAVLKSCSIPHLLPVSAILHRRYSGCHTPVHSSVTASKHTTVASL